MPDIYLRAGEANQNDVNLCDPTMVCGGGGAPAFFGWRMLSGVGLMLALMFLAR